MLLLLLNMESTVDYGPRTATKSSSSGLCGKLNRIECTLITNLCIAYAIITIINSQIGLNFGIFYEIGYLALTFYRRTKFCLTVSVFAHVVCPWTLI